MAASTINIGEFRCRDAKSRFLRKPQRSSGASLAISAIEPEPEFEMDPERLQDALVSENPLVFDIGIARGAQQRPRLVFRPVSVQRRRANVIRFGEPGVAVLRPTQAKVCQQRATLNNDNDLPPAA